MGDSRAPFCYTDGALDVADAILTTYSISYGCVKVNLHLQQKAKKSCKKNGMKGVTGMTHNTGRAKIFTLVLGLALCLAAVFGVASGKGQPARAEETAIDTLEVAFGKAGVGDSLADAFVFEDESAKTLKVPDGANYTATLTFVFKNGQATTLWKEDNASFPWSRVENQTIERKVA